MARRRAMSKRRGSRRYRTMKKRVKYHGGRRRTRLGKMRGGRRRKSRRIKRGGANAKKERTYKVFSLNMLTHDYVKMWKKDIPTGSALDFSRALERTKMLCQVAILHDVSRKKLNCPHFAIPAEATRANKSVNLGSNRYR